MNEKESSSQAITRIALSDSVRSLGSRRKLQRSFSEKSSVRELMLFLSLVILVGILLTRLFGLQVIEGQYYKNLSDKNRIRTEVVHAQRGIIFDRNGKPLVLNMPGFRYVDKDKTVIVDHNDALELIVQGKKLEVDSLRAYTHADSFAHVLGYIGQVTKQDLKNPFYELYRPGDLVGKMGIEEKYEQVLNGVDGKKLYEVDVMGKPIRELGSQDPRAGRDIKLTLDAGLQEIAFKAMESVGKGGLIATTSKGEVLALLSKPSFDPNLFTLGKNYKNSSGSAYKTVAQILSDDQNQPLINRVISGVYPPGSTFKLVTAAAALQDGSIDANFTVEDTGVIQVGAFSFSNWFYTQYGKTDGTLNITKALARSNDIFFYKVAEKLGVEKLALVARKFGLGKASGIDLTGEAKGVVPDEEWKISSVGEKWYLGDTYHYGIGQGYLLVTPLQVNLWTQAVANSGAVYQPHLLYRGNSFRRELESIDQSTFALIRKGMVDSCSPGGVAWPLFDFKVKNAKLSLDGENFLEAPQATTSAAFKDYRKVSIACKTGTAQHGGKETSPHAWITLFAPAEKPQIILTVLAESSGEGSNVAAPIAKKVLEEWFQR